MQLGCYRRAAGDAWRYASIYVYCERVTEPAKRASNGHAKHQSVLIPYNGLSRAGRFEIVGA